MKARLVPYFEQIQQLADRAKVHPAKAFEKAGIAPSTYSRCVRGVCNLSYPTAQKVGDAIVELAKTQQ
jgi:hypothetical protein